MASAVPRNVVKLDGFPVVLVTVATEFQCSEGSIVTDDTGDHVIQGTRLGVR